MTKKTQAKKKRPETEVNVDKKPTHIFIGSDIKPLSIIRQNTKAGIRAVIVYPHGQRVIEMANTRVLVDGETVFDASEHGLENKNAAEHESRKVFESICRGANNGHRRSSSRADVASLVGLFIVFAASSLTVLSFYNSTNWEGGEARYSTTAAEKIEAAPEERESQPNSDVLFKDKAKLDQDFCAILNDGTGKLLRFPKDKPVPGLEDLGDTFQIEAPLGASAEPEVSEDAGKNTKRDVGTESAKAEAEDISEQSSSTPPKKKVTSNQVKHTASKRAEGDGDSRKSLTKDEVLERLDALSKDKGIDESRTPRATESEMVDTSEVENEEPTKALDEPPTRERKNVVLPLPGGGTIDSPKDLEAFGLKP